MVNLKTNVRQYVLVNQYVFAEAKQYVLTNQYVIAEEQQYVLVNQYVIQNRQQYALIAPICHQVQYDLQYILKFISYCPRCGLFPPNVPRFFGDGSCRWFHPKGRYCLYKSISLQATLSLFHIIRHKSLRTYNTIPILIDRKVPQNRAPILSEDGPRNENNNRDGSDRQFWAP